MCIRDRQYIALIGNYPSFDFNKAIAYKNFAVDLDPIANSCRFMCDSISLLDWPCVRRRFRNMDMAGKTKNHDGFFEINFFGHNSNIAISRHSGADCLAHHTDKSTL